MSREERSASGQACGLSRWTDQVDFLNAGNWPRTGAQSDGGRGRTRTGALACGQEGVGSAGPFLPLMVQAGPGIDTRRDSG